MEEALVPTIRVRISNGKSFEQPARGFVGNSVSLTKLTKLIQREYSQHYQISVVSNVVQLTIQASASEDKANEILSEALEYVRQNAQSIGHDRGHAVQDREIEDGWGYR